MRIYKLTRINALLLLTLMLVIFVGCAKKNERTYELLPPDPEMEKDLTELAIGLSVNYENSSGVNAGEGSKKVIDNNVSSKYLINPYRADMYMQLKYDIAQRLDAYTLTSGDDAPDRDPKNWTFAGSNDATQWVTLDTQTGQAFSERKQTKRYEFTNANKYIYYRISITSNNGSGLFQLAEWRVIRRP
jgi:hypothetical protein